MKTLETERLILREWQLEDLDDLYEYTKNPNVVTMAGWAPHINKEASLGVIKSFIKSGDTWAITLKDNGKVIGQLRIYPDENRGKFSERNSAKLLSYSLSEDFWGKGYMTESVKHAVKYAFDEIGTELLTVFHVPHNIRTKRIIEKCGFKYETTIEQGYKSYDGHVFDSICYSILKSNYYGGNNTVKHEVNIDNQFFLKQLENFLDTKEKLKIYPAKQKFKIMALFYLASKFEKGKLYTEKEVNQILNNWHTFEDWAMLRRDLYDKWFIGRKSDCSVYWLEDTQPTLESFGL